METMLKRYYKKVYEKEGKRKREVDGRKKETERERVG